MAAAMLIRGLFVLFFNLSRSQLDIPVHRICRATLTHHTRSINEGQASSVQRRGILDRIIGPAEYRLPRINISVSQFARGSRADREGKKKKGAKKLTFRK